MDPNLFAVLGTLALLTRFGHTLHIMGAVRARSVAAVAARSLIGTACLVLLTFVAGQACVKVFNDPLSAGGNVIARYFVSPGAFLCIVSLALLPASLIGGATAERARVRGLLLITIVITFLIAPLLAWAGYHLVGEIEGNAPSIGLLGPLIISHLVAATSGLALARAIGPRVGKYNRDGSANFIPAHSLPTMITGDLLLLIGLPMLAAALGDQPASRVVNSLLAASAATLVTVIVSTVRVGRFDIMQPWSAVIAGSVCGSLSAAESPLLAIGLGGIVGALLPTFAVKMDLRLHVDETSGLAVPHLLGAALGSLGAATAPYFGASLPPYPMWRAVAAMSASVATIVLVSIVATTLLALLLKRLGWLRVDEQTEQEGLDLAQHDINAYPDFQQTMIKSYHLRQ
jgi:Amt family ammonium transporter